MIQYAAVAASFKLANEAPHLTPLSEAPPTHAQVVAPLLNHSPLQYFVVEEPDASIGISPYGVPFIFEMYPPLVPDGVASEMLT